MPTPLTPSLLRDPVGLLARSPELVALAERSPALRVAIERGRPHDAYRALFWAHRMGKLGDLAPVAATLLQHRRIFLKPLTGRVVMFTYNGVGTSLYGKGDLDPQDSTYVATLYAVVVFVPFFPLGSYLVRDVPGNRRAWNFMAKVPLGPATYLWQRAGALCTLALILFGAAHAFEGYGHNTLHVVSGLDRAVRVELSGAGGAGLAKSDLLAPGGTVEIRTSIGKHALTVRDGDRVLERETVDVPRGRGAVVWNVLGAAPVFVESVRYIAEGKPAPDAPRGEDQLLCGKTFLARDGIDDVFTDPPKHVSMSKTESIVSRTHLGVAPGGLSTCLRYLLSTGHAAEATKLAVAVAGAEQLPASKLTPELQATLVRAPLADAEAFAKALLGRDDSIEAHRIYQNVLMENGLRPRAISEYDARRAARPNDADAQYLALRVLPVAEERSAVDAVVAKYPSHAFLRRIQIHAHYLAREHDQVLLATEALHRLDPTMWRDNLEEHVEALVALGRGEEAMALTREVASDGSVPQPERRQAEVLGYRVAHRIGSPPPTLKRSDDEDAASRLFVRATTGEELSSAEVELVKDPDSKGALRVARAARSSPGSAIELAREAGVSAMSEVPSSVQLLLLGEATRKSNPSDLIPLLAGDFPKPTLDAIVAYVAGGPPSDELAELPLELRAAVDFGRSRAPGLSRKERSDALDRAKSSDVLHGPVSVAIETWAL